MTEPRSQAHKLKNKAGYLSGGEDVYKKPMWNLLPLVMCKVLADEREMMKLDQLY